MKMNIDKDIDRHLETKILVDLAAHLKSVKKERQISFADEAENAKANNLKPYDYFEYLLTEIPKHLEDTDRTFLDDLHPWSTSLPENCRKPGKMKRNKTGANLLLSYRFAPDLYRYVLSTIYDKMIKILYIHTIIKYNRCVKVR